MSYDERQNDVHESDEHESDEHQNFGQRPRGRKRAMTERSSTPTVESDLIRLMLDPEGGREWTLEETRAARARVAADPVLALRLERLRATWGNLELPPPAAAPPGFATHVAALAAEERRQRAHPLLAWSSAPGWARAAAVLALVVGMASGPLLVSALPGSSTGSPASPGEPVTAELVSAEPGLADLYLDALQGESEEGEGVQ